MKLCTVLALAGAAVAVFRDDVSVADWKQTYIGTPVFVSEDNERLAVVSELQSLTCLHSDGKTYWRRTLSADQINSGVAMIDDVILVGGSEISGFNASTGVPIWTKPVSANCVSKFENQFVINNDTLVSLSGELNDEADLGSILQNLSLLNSSLPNSRVVGNQVDLEMGTLNWDDHGVLRLYSANQSELFVRDEGLAHISDALFVPVFAEGEELAEFRNLGVQSPVELFVNRLTRHLGQVWTLLSFVLKNGPAMLVLPEKAKPEFELDQTLMMRTNQGSIYGLNITLGGAVSWVYHDLDAKSLKRDMRSRHQALVTAQDGTVYTISGSGDILEFKQPSNDDSVAETPVDALTIANNVVLSKKFGWELHLPGDRIVNYAVRSSAEVSGSLVVPKASGDVLYKYLLPYTAAFASYKADTHELVLTVADLVSGRILATYLAGEPVLVNEEWPLQLVVGEYWIACTYLGLDESQTMKITMLELFESDKVNVRVSGAQTNVLNDQNVPHVSAHTWVLPSRDQPVYALAISATPFGAGARELVLSLAHQIVALPKAMLTTLKPPAELFVTRNGHLSHIYGVEKATRLVVGRTNSEFTYLVAAIGEYSDLFCSRVSPVGEADRLSYSFPKVKLIIFVSVLGFISITLSPLARNKVLKQQWR